MQELYVVTCGNYDCLGYPFEGLRVTRLKRRPLLVLPGRTNIYTSTHFLGVKAAKLWVNQKKQTMNLQGQNDFIHCHFTSPIWILMFFEEDSDSIYFPTIEKVRLSEVTTILPRRHVPSVVPARLGLAYLGLWWMEQCTRTEAFIQENLFPLPEYPWLFDGIWLVNDAGQKRGWKGQDLNQKWTGFRFWALNEKSGGQVQKSYSGWSYYLYPLNRDEPTDSLSGIMYLPWVQDPVQVSFTRSTTSEPHRLGIISIDGGYFAQPNSIRVRTHHCSHAPIKLNS